MKNAMMFKKRRSNGHMQSLTKLIDFGGAQFTHSSNMEKFIEPTFVVGTPDYMSPEQNISGDYVGNIDVY
jgi:serine/threonine protein kinase